MSPRLLVMRGDFTCFSPPSLGKGGTVVISAAVGAGSPPRVVNRNADVRAIQNALNKFEPIDGGPDPKLVVDGLIGPKTKAAIHQFQKKFNLHPKSSTVPDDIVDPEGPTIRRLRKGPGAIPDLPGEFAARIPRLTEIITAARAVLLLAKTFIRPPGGVPGLGTGKGSAQKVDRHFHTSKLRDPVTRLNEIDSIYLGMLTAIGFIPQGVILAQNEPPRVAEGAFMFTFMGGNRLRIRKPNEPAPTFEGLDVTSIYLCPRARTLNPDGFVYAMTHELAHFVGPTDNGIGDNAYFHKTPDKYRNLSPIFAFQNADCYSQFAFDAIGKPDFNIEANAS